MWFSTPDSFLFSADIQATLITWSSFSCLLISAASCLLANSKFNASRWFYSLRDFYFLTQSTLERCSLIFAILDDLASSLFCSAMLRVDSKMVFFSRAACSIDDFLKLTLFYFSSEFCWWNESLLFSSAFSSLALIYSREVWGAKAALSASSLFLISGDFSEILVRGISTMKEMALGVCFSSVKVNILNLRFLFKLFITMVI